MITAYFYHISTGAPLTDTSVNVYVTVSNARADAKVVDNALMTPMTSFPGGFKYWYECDSEIDYMVSASADDPNYAYQIDKIFIPAVRSGGGGSVNLTWVTASINKVNGYVAELKDEVKKLKEFIKEENDDTNAHMEGVKTEITTKIEGIEIPEMKMEEKEAKKTQKTVEKLDKKITSYIESEMNRKDDREAEKEEIKMKLEEKDRIIEEQKKEIEEHKKEKEEMESLHEILIGDKEEEMKKENEGRKNKLISLLSE